MRWRFFQRLSFSWLTYDIFKSKLLRTEDPLHLPSSISLLWNLQTLIIFSGDMETSPHEIWEMPQLRHIAFIWTYIPDPRPSDRLEQQGGNVSGNLHTLKGVVNLRLSEEVCKRIPNIKELDILYTESNRTGNEGSSYYCLHNLGGFQKLEALRLSFLCIPDRHDHQLNITFPTSLKELNLGAPHFHWEDLATKLGFLPHLEILELHSVEGSEWNPNEGEFLQLKSLRISNCCDLVHWNANDSHFPVLQNLEISDASKLSEIPSGIGEMPTIGCIEICNCSVSAAISAATIVVEQESRGNQELQVVVNFDRMEDTEGFQNMVQELGLNSNNLRLYHQYLRI